MRVVSVALVLPEMVGYCQRVNPKPKAREQIQITSSNIQNICKYTYKTNPHKIQIHIQI